MQFVRLIILIVLLAAGLCPERASADAVSDNPILFVTMVPNPRDFGTLAATFSNHVATPQATFRGGDLWIRYPDGSLKNLTEAAGFGNTGFQGAQSIAVRDPSVHWDGAKAIFSMVIGAPPQQYKVMSFRWQLYEITGLSPGDTPAISKVVGQPSDYNNFAPIYAPDDSIIFASDHPRDESVLHTYPQLDEYESAQTNTGLWRLFPESGELRLLDHAPSGDFNPIIDSFGRVIFTRWDHLQRDQQNVGVSFGAFNFLSETSTASIGSAPEIFPEPRSALDPDYKSTVNLFTINQFFPWMMNLDGSGLETLNHIGRQEVGLYSERSFNNDPNVQEFYGQYSTGQNTKDFTIFLHIKEDPLEGGRYLGTSCPEFGTHSAGQIISITGAPQVNADDMQVTYLTHPDTAGPSDNPAATHSGLYRDPLPLANGKVIAAHTGETRADSNTGTSASPGSRYDFRLKILEPSGAYLEDGAPITSGITKNVSFWDPDQMVTYNGPLWEVMPVELRARQRPQQEERSIPAIENALLNEASVTLSELKEYLEANNLALIISRNVTTRDKNDRQQPTNLRVAGGSAESIPNSGKVYDLSFFQIFQGDLIRGYSSGSSSGRRVLAQPMHSIPDGVNVAVSGAPPGSVEIAADGSVAAFVPARRALSWQTAAADGSAIVRERYWLTLQPGEIRVCTSCHGINKSDHLNQSEPVNSPAALARLLAHWKNLPVTPPRGAKYKLKIKGMPRIAVGNKFQIEATGGSASEVLELSATVKKTACSAVQFKSGSTVRKLKGRLPKYAAGKITFELKRLGSDTRLASKRLNLKSTSARRAVKASRSCAKIMRTLK